MRYFSFGFYGSGRGCDRRRRRRHHRRGYGRRGCGCGRYGRRDP
jgi:hypothetical protein